MTITISQDFSHSIDIKNSRFICQMKRVQNEEEAVDFLRSVKKEHYKANHNCSAFILGEHQEVQRASDDGEPSGTAGVPILEVLKKREITDICVVVTRYFGGIKLGAGGLIRAYAGSVSQALDSVGLVKIVDELEIILTLDYSLFDSLTSWLTVPIYEQTFFENIKVKVFINEATVPIFFKELLDKFNGKITAENGIRRLAAVSVG
ncbi:YigZ family protein [Lactovum miscens]|uniref:Putative YigZ family protein n=1 Tax=Lactovum miscens TaxID=190387 RepID=A0A841C7S5_9LACT|nr:YigZ family protein [Lactovum miscens]MBB5887449.1 putative YigZ family protein [Lactovum miscens]